jgi:hypothetical protein
MEHRHQRAFEQLKEALKEPPVRAFLDFSPVRSTSMPMRPMLVLLESWRNSTVRLIA